MGRPVASARVVPEPARPAVLERLPATSAVSGMPEAAVNVPLTVQPARVLVAQPPLRNRPCTPTGEERRKVVWRLLRWSKLDRPRSRFRLSINCTTVPPGPLKLDASSMDLERV